ncbi:MAG: hypothetical protein E2602_21985 [Achromobacter sp.]|uniref:Uncharacterized protein n=1 Tax=Achromobacter pulmonis TaxID=1389932 RepID=A0A6S7DAU1_9BURK|nr:hypothetical protein [Achromobacter pulmonis]MCF7769941.1 hypothetical protein [Achromobacter pulmonis]MPT29504.1 hypothetical protein [Achromobacter sp.]CAB3627603.1 hypothetical protein LMG26696_00332 [Achromobacter pulmonis]CAB3816911.1 hypothetical protein LMG26788_00062 [Achromobacter pulmonis]
MENINGFQITRGAVRIQDGYLPVIEAHGPGADGRALRGAVTVTEYGVFDDQEVAINAGWNVQVRSIVVDGDGLSIRIDE